MNFTDTGFSQITNHLNLLILFCAFCFSSTVTNIQKYAGVKGLSKNPRTVSSIPKVDPADKCSVSRSLTKQAGKRLVGTLSSWRL
jgi:hypothetical protein